VLQNKQSSCCLLVMDFWGWDLRWRVERFELKEQSFWGASSLVWPCTTDPICWVGWGTQGHEWAPGLGVSQTSREHTSIGTSPYVNNSLFISWLLSCLVFPYERGNI
jgi:hypothetical protein